jgi:maltose alpha-D-glucosyltransferase/alpha-amylase
MPYYPTPDRDDGYDITDFYGVDPRLGTLGQFVEVIRTAEDRGIKVIVDLVVNHTSDQHPWFQEARASRDSRYRDWYVWVDEPPEGHELEEVFPGEQNGTWTYDEEAGQYYLHRFFDHQPDLNIANPEVRQEIARIIGFWVQLGVAGFRVDAVPFLLELHGIEGAADGPDPHQYLKELRAFLQRRRGDAILLGEVNLPPPDQRAFFGDEDGDELHLVFQFSIMQRAYLAMARQDARPLETSVAELPQVPFDSQWATFLRNHDELTLDQLSELERQEVFDAFGPDPGMQIYSGWPTASSSRCRARRCSSTARRSAWARTSTRPDARPCGPRCSGRTNPVRGSRRRTRSCSQTRSSKVSSDPSTSMSPRSESTRGRSSTGSSA